MNFKKLIKYRINYSYNIKEKKKLSLHSYFNFFISFNKIVEEIYK